MVRDVLVTQIVHAARPRAERKDTRDRVTGAQRGGGDQGGQTRGAADWFHTESCPRSPPRCGDVEHIRRQHRARAATRPGAPRPIRCRNSLTRGHNGTRSPSRIPRREGLRLLAAAGFAARESHGRGTPLVAPRPCFFELTVT
ncbi:hypothetical protein CU044_4307 [Streptomyces sp. L-9-10]|nr:hypothetical protein CU044_4307 [Streptomyces sp. L-9-10]